MWKWVKDDCYNKSFWRRSLRLFSFSFSYFVALCKCLTDSSHEQDRVMCWKSVVGCCPIKTVPENLNPLNPFKNEVLSPECAFRFFLKKNLILRYRDWEWKGFHVSLTFLSRVCQRFDLSSVLLIVSLIKSRTLRKYLSLVGGGRFISRHGDAKLSSFEVVSLVVDWMGGVLWTIHLLMNHSCCISPLERVISQCCFGAVQFWHSVRLKNTTAFFDGSQL